MEKQCILQGYVQTSEVCPSRTVASELGISQGKDTRLVEISIGSGPVSHIHFLFSYEDNNLIKQTLTELEWQVKKLPPQSPLFSS